MKSLADMLRDALDFAEAGRFEETARAAYAASIRAAELHSREATKWTVEMQTMANQPLVHS